jgi:hypothetical protein
MPTEPAFYELTDLVTPQQPGLSSFYLVNLNLDQGIKQAPGSLLSACSAEGPGCFLGVGKGTGSRS